MKRIIPYVLLPLVAIGVFYFVTEYRVEQQLENEPFQGIDSNGDGVRDDLDAIIQHVAPTSEKVRAALSQMAVALQNNILHADDFDKSRVNYKAYIQAVDCVYSFDKKQKIASQVIKAMQERTLNNQARKEAYIRFTQHLEGVKVEPTPWQERRKGCNFDPDSMAN